MRRVTFAVMFLASTMGFFVVPASADPVDLSKPRLSFDLSDNNAPASASTGVFNIIVNILPEVSSGSIRIVAFAPDTSDVNNLVCRYRAVQDNQVECAFNFTDNGKWLIRAQYAESPQSPVIGVAVTNLRVTD